MRKIQMVDLKGQYEGIKDQISASFDEVMTSTAFINGPEVQNFQKELEEYLGVKHVIPCGNGTDALQIAMMGLGLKPGDEVITADFTFAATVEVIALLGLTPVLVDVDPDTFNIDPEKVKAAITPKTKAIVPVHLFGQTANMDAIMDIATANNLFVIEDNAQAIGGNYHDKTGATHKTGTIGHIGATSFFPSKNLGCYGDGGAIFTNDDELAHTIRGVVNHGMYERYHHDVVGVNSRLDSLQAAVLRAKLPKLDSYNDARRKSADLYDAALKDQEHIITPVRVGKDDAHVFHQYTLKITNGKRDALVKHFQEHNIPCGVYYPIPLHKQKAYADERYNEADFEITNQLVKEVISLPMHTELDEEQIEFITKTLIEFVNA
ncbi:DegT/DnrJ/EryC1/StrS family aminotransferase [Zunongwangia pacifica]|uniref:DegT/DnrJ/EryC1/StrS family aminotransferase n=1 Tax=Zunongwangia pacifica TaxID=2911062 RepID=A0A9X1ZT25_9FLAO|nr:DegT/DnrJ/EryC1/StrS family aminotransferase [Zunongwangia pacifica]MCL6219621.1 DegT/DnrJ/EryC1/StrS family aminotransferase [Zunongwangia pacifica]